MEKTFLSTVTPVYRGASYLRELVTELARVRDYLASKGDALVLGESIFVDDDSRDGSAQVLRELQAQHEWVKVVTLSRNYGQHAATAAGILHSSGDWVATLDEDLQHHPKHLLALLSKAARGQCDVVYASPQAGPHQSVFRDAASWLVKRLVSRLSGNPHTTKFNSFRIARGSVLRAAASVVTHSTYFDVALCWFTTRIESIELALHDARYAGDGSSGYSFFGLLRHAKRLVVSSDMKVLRAGAGIGVLALFGSILYAGIALYNKIFRPESIPVQGWTSTILAVLFLGGMSCLLMGICLEFMSVLVRHVQGKPTFLAIDRSGDAGLAALLEQWEADADS